ncbi:MAG: TetR family transcriptional regulator [Planctomycetes bacterium]|nr:TetR family transcriptional regulator [Planctomycetota bacterium]
MSKAERTREKILDAALELFREHGYEATTMRMVAEQAGVSTGNAYYYFASKDMLLQAFYREVHDAHVAASAPVLRDAKVFRDRLLGVMLKKLEVIEPYHRFSALMFRSAADPRSPLNPFHPAGDDIRHEGEALFAAVVDGARPRPPKDLAADLPALLWTYSMGMVLYWIHDHSESRQQTRAFIERTVDLVATSVRLAGNPLLRPLRRKALALFRDLAPQR